MQLTKGHKLKNGIYRYRIEEKIGQGGYGITYLARWYQELSGAMGTADAYSIVVIKEFFWSKYCNRGADGFTVSISSAEGKEMMAQLKEKMRKEGKIISKLSHPHIVGIFDIFEENNTVYLVMQYVEGESLKDKINRLGRIDEATALRYTEQLCSALTEIHSKRILHLDIKPGNVLIDEEDNVRLIDFGISKQYDETSQETSDTPLGRSVGYSPVEQYGTLKSFSPPTDIYAAGATLYKMLTGETPIEATSRSQYDLEPVSRFNPNVSKQTEIAVAKAMSEKSRDRYQTVEAFMQALKAKNIAQDNQPKDDDTRIDAPQKETVEVREEETKVEKVSAKAKKQKQPERPVRSLPRDPKPASPLWKRIAIGVGVAIAVLAAIIYFYPGKSSDEEPSGSIPENVVAATPDTARTIAQQESPVVEPPQQQHTPPAQPPAEQPDHRQEAAKLLQQANAVFNNSQSGIGRYEQSYQLYKKSKDMGGDVTAGYLNYLTKAKSLIENGSGFDANVKKMLQYAQGLNNTQEVRDLLDKCK